MPQLLEVSHVSKKEASLRITIPKKAAEAMDLMDGASWDFMRTAETSS